VLKHLIKASLITGCLMSAFAGPAMAMKTDTVLIFQREVKSDKTTQNFIDTLLYSGHKVRSENFINPKKDKAIDGRHVFIYDYKSAELFNYTHSKVAKEAVKYKNARPEKIHLFELSPHFVLRAAMAKDYAKLKAYIQRKGGKKMGTEDIAGYASTMFQWQSAMYSVKVWLSDDLEFLTKVRLESPVGYMQKELLKAAEIEVAADELTVPKDYKLKIEPLWTAMRDFWPKK